MPVRRLLGAFQFLTVIPVPRAGGTGVSERDIGGSSAFFPLVGFVQGAILLGVYVVTAPWFSPGIMAAVLIAVLAATNGGFHLDGLSDTFDALASRKDRTRMLAIMKDSTTGPIGVTSIVIVLLLKYAALSHILSSSPALTYRALVLFPVLGKWSMVAELFHGRSARPDGLGKIFADHTSWREFLSASILTGLAIAGAGLFPGGVGTVRFLSGSFVLLLTVYLAGRGMGGLFHRAFGGVTGDTQGALCEIIETCSLLLIPHLLFL